MVSLKQFHEERVVTKSNDEIPEAFTTNFEIIQYKKFSYRRETVQHFVSYDRPHTTFCWSAIVNIALSCTVFELFDVE